MPWGRSVPLSHFPHSFRPSRRARLLLQQEMSLLGDDEGQGENGSAYRAGATVLTVPLSNRHRETIITSHGSFDVPRRVRTPPRDLNIGVSGGRRKSRTRASPGVPEERYLLHSIL